MIINLKAEDVTTLLAALADHQKANRECARECMQVRQAAFAKEDKGQFARATEALDEINAYEKRVRTLQSRLFHGHG